MLWSCSRAVAGAAVSFPKPAGARRLHFYLSEPRSIAAHRFSSSTAGEKRQKFLLFILSVGSWGIDMKQVEILKPDVPSRAVVFSVFMT